MNRILYFASLADTLGRTAEDVDLPPEVQDVGALLDWLRQRGDAWNRLLADENVKVTVNQQFADRETPLQDGDEIALVGMAF
jgi:sulfur-carrier protein